MSKIIEYIGKDGVVYSELTTSRLSKPRPGDLIRWPEGELGRVDAVDASFLEAGQIHVCESLGSAFLGRSGLSISGGPFRTINLSDLTATMELAPSTFWNWGDNSPGADQGVHFTLHRPLFQYGELRKRRPLSWITARDFLHNDDGTHRDKAPTTSGRQLHRFVEEMQDHLADGHTHNGPLMRGNYQLGHQSQQIERDWMGETIAKAFDKTSFGYRLDADQLEERRTGQHADLPYEYLLYSPGWHATNWTAFYTLAELWDFCDAYDLHMDHQPEPGGRFTLQLPDDGAFWLPLRKS